MLQTFIKHSVFTVMLMAAVVVFGLYAYPRIGVDQYPNVDIPYVSVTTLLPGADPESIEKNVTDPLEEALNTVNGVDELNSINLENVSQVTIAFKLGTDVNTAAQDVRDRVQATLRSLPDDIETPVVEKFDIGAAPILTLSLSGSLPVDELTRVAEDVVKPALQSQPGVGSIGVVGGREREVQLVVDPQRLRGYGLAIGDVSQALQSQSVDLPGGRTTQGGRERIVRLTAEARSVNEIGDIIVASPNGTPVRVRDVAAVVDGAQEARGLARSDTGAAIALVVRKQSGANTVQVAEAVKESLAELNSQLPEGVTVSTISDNSTNIRASIHAVQEDMLLGGVLSVLIVLVFLRNLRSTLVSAIALPVSVIGTFAVMALLGFTFNIITMLALTLSIGLLIDDAIVVIENIVRHLEEGKTPMQAALEGTKQIAIAVLAVTLAIVAVFVPVAFMEGMIGQFFFQFGVTVAVAVLISYAVSMTLTPMLSSRLLKGHGHGAPTNRVSVAVERALVWVENGYRRVLGAVLNRRGLAVAAAVGVLVLTLGMARFLKFTFIPPSDNGAVRVTLELPVGSTLEDTERELTAVAQQARTLEGVKETFSTAGGGTLEEVHKGEVLVNLVPRKERSFDQETFKVQLRSALTQRPGVLLTVQDAAGIGGGRNQQVQYVLRGTDWSQVVAGSEKLLAAMKSNPGLTDVDTTFRSGKPQYDVRIDRERAAKLGVPAAQVGLSLRAYLGRDEFMTYREGGETYDVKLRLPDATLASEEALGQLTVRSTNGQLVELRNVANITPSEGPVQIDRQNQRRQITLLANLAPGYTLGEGMAYLTAQAQQDLPKGVVGSFAGNAKELGKTTAAFATALGLGILLLYMILAAQFGSYVHPFTIMLSLPFALIGAIGALLLSGHALSIFALIGVIMLMGLVVKNGILLVDFTQQLREAGRSARDALLEAAPMRLRPILMTTIAMVAGMVPVALARGDGAEMRVPMALVIIGGLISSTVLTLVVVPVVYSLLDGLSARFKRREEAAPVAVQLAEEGAH
ncbi:FAD linked oxidase [Corallococcus coralloides DSM 2259]|uniref:FAD linked oxidase n=1 Tax=Corallococcus coralloides (strain ATCC 25202 / DSM 2259 / NBRC 100086 / M2) TaxID=1144275 RepID=H8N1I6_CORCM|nr:efflux RND transporter permease subunit [Corallococcus coralloides]AFE09622.1 FAD linked oxidase [Corallococcus coralloides DSM 2259]